jgi:anti-anti-sigma factor
MNIPAFVPARIECERGIPVVAITGRPASTNAPLFDGQADPAQAEVRSRILQDFSGLTYISSAGLGSIIRIAKCTAVRDGCTGIFAVPAHILELIAISGFQPILEILP